MTPFLLLVALAFAAPIALAATARVDGLDVHYESLGKGGRAVVFIHGWTCDHTFWRLNAPEIARRYRVLLVDLPGHGQSAKPEIAYTIPLFARAVEAVMRHAGVERAVLAGHSMGVPVIRQFLREFPAKAVGAVMVDGRISRKPPEPGTRSKSAGQMRAEGVAARARMIEGMFVEKTAPALREEIRKKMLAAPRHVAISAYESMAEPALHQLDPIPVPALVLLAKWPWVADDEEQFLRTLIAQLDYEAWEGAGHFLMMEEPERFNRKVLEFLDKRVRW